MSTIKKANQEREGTDADTQIVALIIEYFNILKSVN